jgi:hypothetical protein
VWKREEIQELLPQEAGRLLSKATSIPKKRRTVGPNLRHFVQFAIKMANAQSALAGC